MLLHLTGKLEHVHLSNVIHCHHQIPLLTGGGSLEGLPGCGYTLKKRRVAEVEFPVFPGNALVQPAVLFKREIVVVVTDQENPPDSPGHERGVFHYTSPWSTIAPATLMKPAIFAPLT